MTYRELLDACKEKPGWIRAREQNDIEFEIKYRTWLEKLSEAYENEKKTNKLPHQDERHRKV